MVRHRLAAGDAADLEDRYKCHLGSEDLQTIAHSCPGLTKLHLCHVVRPEADLNVLVPLGPSLQSLTVAGAAFNDNAVAAVAQLTALNLLRWRNPELSDNSMQQLSTLQRLTRLEVDQPPPVTRAAATAGAAGARFPAFLFVRGGWAKPARLVLETTYEVRWQGRQPILLVAFTMYLATGVGVVCTVRYCQALLVQCSHAQWCSYS